MQSFEFQVLRFPVRVGPDALFLAALLLIFGVPYGGMMSGVLFALVAVGSILVHELGHALLARRFGLGPIHIAFTGIGGLTTHRRPAQPWKSLLISLAGPGAGLSLVPLALGLALLPLDGLARQFVEFMLFINLFWSLFNLLPLFPLDGGNALASLLQMFVPNLAYRITFGIGLVGSVAAGLWFLSMGEYFLVALLGFLAARNWQGLQQLQQQAGTRRRR